MNHQAEVFKTAQVQRFQDASTTVWPSTADFFFFGFQSFRKHPGFGWEVRNAGGCSEGSGDHDWWQSCKNSGLRQLKVRSPRCFSATLLNWVAFCVADRLRKKLSRPTRFDGYGFAHELLMFQFMDIWCHLKIIWNGNLDINHNNNNDHIEND